MEILPGYMETFFLARYRTVAFYWFSAGRESCASCFFEAKKRAQEQRCVAFCPDSGRGPRSSTEIGCKRVKSAGVDVIDVMGVGFVVLRWQIMTPGLFWHLTVESHRQNAPRLLAGFFFFSACALCCVQEYWFALHPMDQFQLVGAKLDFRALIQLSSTPSLFCHLFYNFPSVASSLSPRS